MTKDWDFSIGEKEGEFLDDLREASGIGWKRKRVSEPAHARIFAQTLIERPNDSARPSQQVRSLIGDGNQAYGDSTLPEAIRMMQEVIRIEPPRRVRALCYEDVEQGQETLQLKIMAPSTRCG